MAIFSKLILGSTLLSSVALAAPFGIPFGVKPAWTVWKTDYTTVDMTTTIYIDGTSTLSGANVVATAAPTTVSTTASVETSSPSAVSTQPAQTFAAPSTTMSTAAVPTIAPAAVSPPASSNEAPAAVAPAPVAPTTSTTAAAVAPTSSAAAAASVAPAGDASMNTAGGPASASDTATCQGEGAACEGDITYYGGGLGACGVNVDPNGNGIALPAAFMGAQSNGNPYCGKTMTIFNPATGQSTTGVVMDKCPGCSGRSIDMMEANMNSITNGQAATLGRVSGVEWWFD